MMKWLILILLLLNDLHQNQNARLNSSLLLYHFVWRRSSDGNDEEHWFSGSIIQIRTVCATNSINKLEIDRDF